MACRLKLTEKMPRGKPTAKTARKGTKGEAARQEGTSVSE